MQLILTPHPATPPSDPDLKVWANVEHAGSLAAVATTSIWFGVGAAMSRFAVPEPIADAARADGLWQTTCFEAFLRPAGGEAYREWNFSPSGQWAAYDFTARREGMVEGQAAEPYIRVEDNLTWWGLGAAIAVPANADLELGLSAVLEESDGRKSYWALGHGGEKPDFHDPGCFTARLA
ncbi:MAG: DOMON-like domain-containing protein [Sphingomicrobium sp.]